MVSWLMGVTVIPGITQFTQRRGAGMLEKPRAIASVHCLGILAVLAVDYLRTSGRNTLYTTCFGLISEQLLLESQAIIVMADTPPGTVYPKFPVPPVVVNVRRTPPP